MSYLLLCLGVFVAAYVVNLLYISVFYHRGLTHNALTMSPALKRFVYATGGWMTGLDAKGWCCMHRLHHRYSDTAKDPHSPVHKGIFGIALHQLYSYKRVLKGLMKKEPEYVSVVQDFDCDVSWQNKLGLWYLPYILHGMIAVALGLSGAGWLLGLAYFLGIMSHPVQGWMVNSLGHALGYRNYGTTDNSKNNTLVAWLVAGEGYQNNHHRYPQAVKFSMKWYEFDWGYGLCWALRKMGLIDYTASQDKEALSAPEPWELANSNVS
jgi:stearoyl-CoA desaturase (delta-9 desaturase)